MEIVHAEEDQFVPAPTAFQILLLENLLPQFLLHCCLGCVEITYGCPGALCSVTSWLFLSSCYEAKSMCYSVSSPYQANPDEGVLGTECWLLDILALPYDYGCQGSHLKCPHCPKSVCSEICVQCGWGCV